MVRWAVTRLVLLTVFLVANPIYAQCGPSALSRKEAQSLLEVIPGALAAEHSGGKLSAVDWSPGSGYRLDAFYFYELLSTKSLKTTPLENGVIGYFGVNKTTGQIVELNSARSSVQGAALTRMQNKIRLKHCISPELVRSNRDIPLEK
jgi:hypothetical protein